SALRREPEHIRAPRVQGFPGRIRGANHFNSLAARVRVFSGQTTGGCDWGELRWLGCWLGCWPCRRWAAPRLELEIHILHQRTSSDCGDPGRKRCHPAECGIPYVLSYYSPIIVGFPPTLPGLLLAPLSALIALSSPLAGKLFDRLNQPLTLVIIGALFQGLITVALSFAVGAKSNILQIEILMAALGITGGLLWAPVLSTVLFFVR